MTARTVVLRCMLRGTAADEIAKFSLLNEPNSWSVNGPMRALHLFNQVRVPHLVEMVHHHMRVPSAAVYGSDGAASSASLASANVTDSSAPRLSSPHVSLVHTPLHILDVGCGGGVLSECLVSLGARVTGVDACAESVAAARRRQRDRMANARPPPGVCTSDPDVKAMNSESLAATSCVGAGGETEESKGGDMFDCDFSGSHNQAIWDDARLQFRHASILDMAESMHDRARYDVVVASEVMEHVSDARSFLTALCALLRPGGLLFITTMDKSVRAVLKYVLVAEYLIGLVPRNTHDWTKFIPPRDLSHFAQGCGVHEVDLSYVSVYPNVASTIASGQVQLRFKRTGSTNTGHYMWTGIKCAEPAV